MEAKYSKSANQELDGENKRLKEAIAQLQKQLSENQAPLQVQTIYKDSTSIT